jgi:hypothetical protein
MIAKRPGVEGCVPVGALGCVGASAATGSACPAPGLFIQVASGKFNLKFGPPSRPRPGPGPAGRGRLRLRVTVPVWSEDRRGLGLSAGSNDSLTLSQ